MPRLLIATCRPLPEPDPDEEPLLQALRAQGVDARLAAWHDPAQTWDAPTVLRSTWDYYRDLPAFLAWVDRVAAAVPLWNPPDVLRWNVHKTYLRELEARGLPVVPTVFLPRGEPWDLAWIQDHLGSRDLIFKPAVSASSYRTRRFTGVDEATHGEARAFLGALTRDRDAMVQPYLPEVEGRGERSMILVDGELTHAMRKSPRMGGEDERVTGPFPMEDDERDLAWRALSPFVDRLLYGRVDMVRDNQGSLRIMELELLEPSLFLHAWPPALARMVEALRVRLS